MPPKHLLNNLPKFKIFDLQSTTKVIQLELFTIFFVKERTRDLIQLTPLHKFNPINYIPYAQYYQGLLNIFLIPLALFQGKLFEGTLDFFQLLKNITFNRTNIYHHRNLLIKYFIKFRKELFCNFQFQQELKIQSTRKQYIFRYKMYHPHYMYSYILNPLEKKSYKKKSNSLFNINKKQTKYRNYTPINLNFLVSFYQVSYHAMEKR
eukprot:TRINITY_DN4115_c0_g2_i2.p1 TRINITY_DN4115_c0_g2~~TRINITY_DN4115_c0_g2_i2.p1  ORF type:complete len:207 (-),score=-13.87 TRINITY_DN4115_c0_g2_i2:94-714(-)